MIHIKGKRILFVGIDFYDYEKVIKEEFERRGAEVYYFSSDIACLGNGPLHRLGLHSLAIRLVGNKLQKLLDEQPSKIDYVFIIKALNFQKKHFDYIKKRYPNASIVIYLWDSINRLYNKTIVLSATNRILTFDRRDAVKYNLILRPLFARSINNTYDTTPKYDISFIGLDHSIRYAVIRKLRTQMNDKNIKYRIVLTTKRIVKFFGLYITHRIRKTDADLFYIHSIPYSEYLQILNDSKVVLDIAHPKQTGLTMRTIETLAMGKRILTTNKDIVHYNISKELYQIIDIKHPQIDLDFIRYNKKKSIDMTMFTLEKFVDDIISEFAK